MPTSFKAYHDAALTQEITSLNPLVGPGDVIFYLGSTAVGTKAQATSDPGVDPIVVSIVDANAGSGAPATEFKLALSSGGLASAVAGASLTLGATLLSGVANAVPVYTRRTTAIVAAGVYTDLSLSLPSLVETAV